MLFNLAVGAMLTNFGSYGPVFLAEVRHGAVDFDESCVPNADN
jgi:hypothetical protein